MFMAIVIQRRLSKRNNHNLISKEDMLKRQLERERLLHKLLKGGKCRELIRVSEQDFRKLCTILQRDDGLLRTQGCIYRVLRSVVALESYYIQQPKGDVVPKEIQEKKRFYPYFKNGVWEINGTHVRVKVPNKDVARYRGHKGYPTINVLVACSFDLKFTYVLTMWEGTASDSRIVKDALKRDDKLLIPRSRYCLVDAGLPHTIELMTPYRGVRVFCSPPVNARELFNLRHASLRNAIKRAFGVLKRRFPIIRSTHEPFYLCDTQSYIFVACCILHNFLLDEDRDKKFEYEVLQEVLNEQPQQVRHDVNNGRLGSDGAEELRDVVTTQMWDDYLLKPNNEINIHIFPMDNVLVEALVKDDQLGNRVHGTITSQTYANMIAGMSKEFNRPITKDKWYDMYRGTLLSGFSWNSLTKYIEAGEEANPDVAALKTKKISNYDQLVMLFSDDRTSRAKAETKKEKKMSG
uniref:DDE Tnp4 domain-containing protein n=1 Tax=Lactuca sativa TaxID=4236 RepID=A0A9R1VB57_LACSA|nr:hypothetical protein LSAT_V11C500239260 [Lactuca sativa]